MTDWTESLSNHPADEPPPQQSGMSDDRRVKEPSPELRAKLEAHVERLMENPEFVQAVDDSYTEYVELLVAEAAKVPGLAARLEATEAALRRYLGIEDGDDMCENCVTPWKCNGPHVGADEQARAALAALDKETQG